VFLIKNPKILIYLFFLSLLVYSYRKAIKIGSIATKKLGEFATPSDDYLRAPITQPVVDAVNYEIKTQFITLVRQTQFGGSASEVAVMHLNIFTQICDIMCIKDANPNTLKLRSFLFHLEGKKNNGCYHFLRELLIHGKIVAIYS
jgi:hypothetical protein